MVNKRNTYFLDLVVKDPIMGQNGTSIAWGWGISAESMQFRAEPFEEHGLILFHETKHTAQMLQIFNCREKNSAKIMTATKIWQRTWPENIGKENKREHRKEKG